MDPEKPKRHYLKFVIAFAAIIFFAVGGIAAYGAYRKAQREKNIERIAEGLKQEEEKLYQEQLADTYGGTTPQETLSLFIAAALKGDYELASKYFVAEKRSEELLIMHNSEKNKGDFITYIGFLKGAEPWRSSLTDSTFTMKAETPLGYSAFARFIKYPSGVWKINEI